MNEVSLVNVKHCTDKSFMTFQKKEQMQSKKLFNGIFWGLIGGFAGTVIMDLACVGFFKIAGIPVELIYSFIGDAARNFLLKTGMDFPWSVPLGAFVHFFLGLSLGSLLGAFASKINIFRQISLKKGVLLGILYIEIASQPILVTAPLFKEMTASGILQWYALSTVMHSIYGIILGGILSYKQRKAGFNE